MTHEQNYQDQRNAGRLMGDTVPSVREVRTPNRLHLAKKSIAPKGHEAFLKALESSGATLFFDIASSGDVIKGVIKTSDKYTISIQEVNGTRVIFKHDISSFYVEAPAAKPETH
jgi:sRNA-binding regulator protein Hfq